MSVFAARYARALADVVLDAKLNTAEVEQQLEDFAATFAGSKDLRELLLNPSLSAQKRVAILDKINGRRRLRAAGAKFPGGSDRARTAWRAGRNS